MFTYPLSLTAGWPYTTMQPRKLLSDNGGKMNRKTCPVCGRNLVNLYVRGNKWKCKQCWDFHDKVKAIVDNNRTCEVCVYGGGDCSGRISLTLGGLAYPPCMEGNSTDFIDESLVDEVYNDIMEERNNGVE